MSDLGWFYTRASWGAESPVTAEDCEDDNCQQCVDGTHSSVTFRFEDPDPYRAIIEDMNYFRMLRSHYDLTVDFAALEKAQLK